METKKWYQSKTIWGFIIAALGFSLSHFLKVDVNVPADATFDQVKASVEAAKAANGSLSLIMSQVVTIIGLVVGIVGRVKAETKIA